MPKRRPEPVGVSDQTGHSMALFVHNDGANEYVGIENLSSVEQPLTGWVLASLAGQQFYEFPAVVLGPRAKIRIHSGPGAVSHPPTDLLWTNDNVWNNATDVAILFDVEGHEISRASDLSSHRAHPSYKKPKVLIREDGSWRIGDAPILRSGPE